jgi:hypothetical protein
MMCAESSQMPYLYHPLWFCGRWNPCRQTRRQERRKHTEKKNKKDADIIRNNENYELLATDSVRRECVAKNKECVFLTVKIGHRVHYIFADVKVNTEIYTTPKTNTQL